MYRSRRLSILVSLILIPVILTIALFGAAPTHAESAGYALSFDGSNDFVKLTYTAHMLHADWETEKTVNLWVRPVGTGRICAYPNPGWCDAIFGDRPRWWGISRGVLNGQDRIWIYNVGGGSQTIGVIYTPDEWVNIALVHSGGILRAYKNGVQVGSMPSGPTMQPNTGALPWLQIGGIIINETRNWTFRGELDEVRLWNRALSEAEVQADMYRSLTGNENGLAAYYKMSDGAGLSLTDDSGHGWTGTLYDGGGILPPDGSPPQWVASGAFTGVPVTDTPTATTPAPTTPAPTTPAPTTPVPTTPVPTTPVPTTPPPGGAIFSDGFESGDLSAWPGSIIDGGDLSVAPAAALQGAFGLRALINNTTMMYARDDSPQTETHYRAAFQFDPNSLTMADRNHHIIFGGIMLPNRYVVRVEFQKIGGQYQVRAAAATDANVWKFSPWVTISDGPHRLELEWTAASASGANNGSVSFWVDGASAGAATGIDNDTLRVDQARLGPSAGLDAGTSGEYFFDAFESSR